MNRFVEPAAAADPGLSRRQVLCRFGGGLAGALLASLGLIGPRSEVSAGRVVSLRAVLQRISPNCSPAHGIRLILPDDGGPISLKEIIRRFYPG
jgi:hypothetical protein